MSQPNNVIKLQLTQEDLGMIIIALHDLERRMIKAIHNDDERRMAYPISKLMSQLDTAAHALGQCESDKEGCAYEQNQVTHYRLFKDLIDAEIKPGNKTP